MTELLTGKNAGTKVYNTVVFLHTFGHGCLRFEMAAGHLKYEAWLTKFGWEKYVQAIISQLSAWQGQARKLECDTLLISFID